MHVDVSNPPATQGTLQDEQKHFVVGGDVGPGQPVQRVENVVAVSEIAERQLTRHKRMTQHSAVIEHSDERGIGASEMVDPY